MSALSKRVLLNKSANGTCGAYDAILALIINTRITNVRSSVLLPLLQLSLHHVVYVVYDACGSLCYVLSILSNKFDHIHQTVNIRLPYY